MKHKQFFLLKSTILGFFLFLLNVSSVFAWNGGSGISGDPYLIANATQLKELQTTVNGGQNYSGKYFRLTANIDLSGSEWIPIGTSTAQFKGNFDGNNYTISGLHMDMSVNDVGLFGNTNLATISRLGVSTSPGGVKGNNNVGILIGTQNGGSVTNCYVMGNVSGNDVVGGLIGNQNSSPTVAQCFAVVNVTHSGTAGNGTGGLIGVVRGTLSDSYAWGDVKGIGAVGGLIGTISTNGVVNACYATGNAISTASAKAGGLTGAITQASSRLRNSVALNKTVEGHNSSVGRVVGFNQYDGTTGILNNNYATSDMQTIINNKSKSITSDINGYDGATQSAVVLKTRSFYATSVSWSINSINDNTKNWNIWENVNLPYLQTQSSPVTNFTFSGTTLRGEFRPDVSMDSIGVYLKNGASFTRLGKVSVNNSAHTWMFNDPTLAMIGTVYVIAYESGKSWPSYPVTYNVCGLPLTFDTINGETYISALNLRTCITNLQHTTINDIQFSKADGAAFDANIIPAPASFPVDNVQTIYARATNSLGCQSIIKSFQVKPAEGTLLFKEDFGSGAGCTNEPLGSNITTYTFGGDLKLNGNYNICSQLGSYYQDYWYFGSASYDHTDPGNGRSLIVDADFEPGQFYTLKIKDICPGTHLHFSAWVFNLMNSGAPNTAFYGPGNFNDPDVRFVLTDGISGDILKIYDTGSIPKVTNPADNWRPFGFDFITSSSSVILTLYNNGPGGNGNDLMLDDIEVYGNIPPVMIDGPSYYCLGDPLNLTVKNLDKTAISNNVKVNWLFSENGSMGFNAKWDTIPDLTAVHLDMPFQKPGYLRAVVGVPEAIDEKLFNCCSMSEPKPVMLTPDLMYWKRDALDYDWNNPDNWVDVNDNPLHAVPSKCTDVHIPGNARRYPSLEIPYTNRTEYYGEPKCRDITYHFGSEVAKPHYLDYRKAYIQYNFGYYNGSDYVPGWDTHSAAPIGRGHWYALAAPLKNIVSSDFSVGGFPNMWQRGFKSSLDRTGTLNGDWYVPENTAALEIGARQNYAISIWAGEYLPGELGEDDHKNLNDLKGILQMPYFENPVISPKHRIHTYMPADSASRFNYYYYQIPGLPIEPSKYDDFKRGSKSYRFVFEDNNNKPMDDFAVTVPAGTEIMIGNPFISSLDFRALYARNSSVIEDYYRLFVDNTFQTYSLSTGGNPVSLTTYIASFQGFFIKTKGTSGTVTLYFPSYASVVRTESTAHQFRSSFSVDNEIYISSSNKSGNSWATIAVNDNRKNSDVPQLFIDNDYSTDIPQIYTLNEDKKKNVIQHVSGNQAEIPLGIKCESQDSVKLTVANVENMDCESLTLTDTRLNKTIDLFAQNMYVFKNEPGSGERFLLRIGNPKIVTGIESLTDQTLFRLSVSENILAIESSEAISMIDIYSLQGIKVLFRPTINATSYNEKIQLPAGVYIVTVKLQSGELKTRKMIIH